jgi:4-carboxymuconolactone decarboxylase
MLSGCPLALLRSTCRISPAFVKKESAMRQDSVRIAPLALDEFTDEQKALVGEWHHLNFSRVLVQHPGMYRVFLPFLDKVIRGSNLPPRDREILCLRTLALGCDVYEAHHHVTIARKAGMTDAEIEAARTGGAGLGQFDQCLLRAAEELVRQQCVSDQTWACLAECYSREQLMETVFVVGCYTIMATITRSFGMEVEQDPETEQRLAKLRQYT